jgi:hypothetical protein
MSLLLALFAVSALSCFNLVNVVFPTNYQIFGNSCWFLRKCSFAEDANLTIHLGVADSDTFFGMDTNDTHGLPANLFIVQDDLPVLEELDYDAFRAPVLLLCGKSISDEYLRDCVFTPVGVRTSEDDDVVFGMTLDRGNSDYSQYFGTSGTCIQLIRSIGRLDDPGVSAGECVGLILGLLAGGILITWCIIWLAPIVKKAEESEKENETNSP